MANVLTTTTTLASDIANALDRKLRFELRANVIWRQFVDEQTNQLTNPGSVAILKVHDSNAIQTAPLSETADPDSIALPVPRTVTVTAAEQGAHTIETLRLRNTAYQNVIQLQARNKVVNMLESIDRLVMRAHDAGTIVQGIVAGAVVTNPTEASIVSTDTFTGSLLGRSTAKLRSANVMGMRGEHYVAVMSPLVSYDIQQEGPSSNSWLYAHANGGDTSGIYNGEVGLYRGALVIESNKVRVTATGTGSIKVFTTYVRGASFLTEHIVVEPRLAMGDIGSDAFGRFVDVGWYGDLGWATYNDVALLRLKTTSSLQADGVVLT